MSLIAYSRFRRQGLRKAWSFAGMTGWAVEVGTAIVAILILLAVVGWIDASAVENDRLAAMAKKEQARADNHERAWLSCLNRGAVYVDGKAHLCQLADLKISNK